jgi:hypothetical protein
MFTILVVAPEEPSLEALAGARPSIEVLRARGVDEAIEKLGRNRRVDAVLLLGPGAAEAIEEIRAENPAGPPLFTAGAHASGAAAPGAPPAQAATHLGDAPPGELLDRIAALLE